MRLFQDLGSFSTWVRLHDPDGLSHSDYDLSALRQTVAPVYFASVLELDQVLPELLKVHTEQSESTIHSYINDNQSEAGIDATFGNRATALQAVAVYGHKKVVQMLLERNADVNAQGGHHGNALQAVFYFGRGEIVQNLIDHWADALLDDFDILYSASRNNDVKVVRVLLDKGAQICAGEDHSALYQARERCHVDICAERYSAALDVASECGHEKVVQVSQEYKNAFRHRTVDH